MAVDDVSTENDSTSVHVAVRVRPQSAREKLEMSQICTSVLPNVPQIVLGKDSSFTFDYVFNINSAQETIFNTLARPLIDGCLNGYNATILAYGQTGSGKTYTMGTGFDLTASNQDAGIIPRAVQYLFARISQCRAEAADKHQPVPEFKVVAQFLELYNEELVDLLDADRSRKPHLRLHENAQGDIYLTGVSTRLVSSLNDTLKCLRDGSLVRSTASTNMNAQSSRSHAIFTLHVRQQRLVKYEEDSNGPRQPETQDSEHDPDSTVVDPIPEYETLTAKFHFVDLAGSERLKRTGATGDRAKEGISINRGLLALGNVISALGDKAKRGCHVPYRDSKLTRLLQDSLGGNSRTIMIACISPSDCDFLETLNTLKYANRARNIRNRIVMNQDKTSKQLSALRAQLAALQEELDGYRQGKLVANSTGADGASDVSKELALWRGENEKLRLRVKALTVTVNTLKVRNAQLLADLEASSWASSKEKLLHAAQGDSAEQNTEDGERSSLNLIVGEMDSVRELVEKYTVEIEELRTKLAEAEALAEFSQRPLTYTSPCQPGRLGIWNSNNFGPSNRVALSNSEFPDLDTSTVAAAEAGLSVANTYLDDDVELESTMIASSVQESDRHKSRRHRHRRNKSKSKKAQQQQQERPVVDDRKPFNDLTPNGEPDPSSDSAAIKAHETSGVKEDDKLHRNSGDVTMNGECYTDLEEDELSEGCGAGDEAAVNLCDNPAMENEDPDALEATLLGEQADEDGLTHSVKAIEEYADGTLSDASDVQSSSDSSGSNESDDDSDGSSHQTDPTENEAKLHQSIARVSSQIDSKQRLLAELQAKAAQLDHLRRHYERKLNDLETRIRETEKERDRVLANLGQLEHIGEERLRRTQEEFQKKLSSLQDSLKQLQQAKSDHTRLEREQAKKNGELRQLRKELEELRRYKVDLAKRLQEETRRTRQLEVTSARQVMELKRAKTQADHQIRSLEAAHSAKERALQQKQAELEALKRKTLAQQRQLSSMASGRMARSYMGGASSPRTTASMRRQAAGNLMSTSMLTSTQGRINLRLQPTTSVKAKWTHIVKQLELEVQRRQTSARLEHDLQTWIREREHLSRRLQRLQRRRARVEEALPDEPEQEDITRVTTFDEQIRNVTAQLDSVQEAIRECQTSIIELDKFGPKVANTAPASRAKFASARSAMIHTLFANCTLSESRFLLSQLYEDAITRALQVNRLQHSEAQLRANLSVWEQERQQELEVLRLAMQHAGLPLDTVDNVISVAGSSESNKNVNICPHHGPMTGNTCDCCSVTGVTSSAPISSDDSSDEEQKNENRWSSGMYPVSSIRPNDLMSQSMYATIESSSFSGSSRRHFSETEEPGSDRPDTADASGRPIKARLRVLLPQDMLGLSSTQGPPGPDSSAAEIMPPPSSSVLLRRARTALPPFVTTGAQLMYTPSVDSTSVLRSQTVPLSAGPSPAVRRRVPTQCTQPASSMRQNLPAVHSVPSSMSASFTLGSQTTSTNEGPDTNTKHEVKSGPAVPGNTDIDVFNRLTSGMSSSPHPSRGSIQPLQRSVPAPPSPTSGTSANIVTVSHSPPASYRLAEPTTTSPTASMTVSASGAPSSTSNQPLAAFFANLSVQQPSSTVAPTTCNTSTTSFSGNLPGQSLQTSASFRVPMECTHIARGHSSAILDVEIAGNLMVTGSKDRTAKIWDLETMEEVETLRDHPNNVCKVRVCPVTGLVFTVCSYFIKVWDRRDTRKCVRTLLSSGLSQDGELDMKVTRRQNICPPGETNIMDVALGGSHPALSHYMFLATANSVKLWDLRRYFAVGKLHGFHQAPVMVLAAGQTPALSSADEPQLTVVTGSKDHYIKVFSVGPNASALLTPTFDLEPPHYDGIESLALDRNTLFSGSRDGVIKKWNLGRSGRQEVMLAQAHKDWIEGLAITTDGMNLVSGCRAGTLKLWNVEDCTCLGEVPNAHDGAINAIRTHGDRIFTAGSDKDVRFWCLLDRVDN